MVAACRRIVAVAALIGACGPTAPGSDASPAGTATATATATAEPTSTSTGANTSTTTTTSTSLPRPVIRHVMIAGDSVTRGEVPALEAALSAGGVQSSSIAFDGAGIMAAPDHSLDVYQEALDLFAPDLVVYQLSLWDRGTRAEQDAAYRAFTALVASTGAQLVFVTIPPMKRPDEHRDVAHLRSVAAALADEQPGTVHLLDADVVWGPTFVRDIGADGVADRMPDGVHICQGGAMRFADWLTGELADLFDGLRVPAPAEWVFGTWNASTAYDVPEGACDPVAASSGVPSNE